ncbi:hypothetical protein [Mucilaginibacter sp. OK098]|uniref:hypothetical protein n=1 Tax=Mucilaginibacter sp. OK098 TaxID=1855297 RepID=UPI0009208758|nr:hypothetical protein [Mucilaginibacter sp. OK098]SHN11314.1 hypothetical protein SAMN05216524_105315 [Mucilaginibacter sp. OK098]
MAEHEIIKHTREIIKVVKNPGELKHKIGDTILEIAIIVFAITLSLFVERYREHQQEQKLEHSFLTNLVGDLKNDLDQLHNDSDNYARMDKSFAYLKQAYNGKKLNPDSASKAINYLYNTIEFVPSNSRYEALKASGKLDVIENKNLQVEIVNLYQQTIASLLLSTRSFSDFKNKLSQYTDDNLVISKNGTNIQELMQRPKSYNLVNRSGYIQNIIDQYHGTITQTRKIIKEIEEEERNW